jgi:Domain of unknown function (DUF4442)
MSYQYFTQLLVKYIEPAFLFKHAFNLSPMYRRTTGRIRAVSKDLKNVEVVIPLSYRNVNYVGTMFGGSMLSATDPILMVQLLQILGKDFVVWDKAVEFHFKRPVKDQLLVRFDWSDDELEHIKTRAEKEGEFEYRKNISLQLEKSGLICAESTKIMYIATKSHYQQKLLGRQERDQR